MKLLAFSLLDIKTGAYSTPFFFPHPGQAIRAVIDLARDMDTTVGRHPADYDLRQVGVFDDATGLFESFNNVSLGTVVGFLPPPQPQLFQNKE